MPETTSTSTDPSAQLSPELTATAGAVPEVKGAENGNGETHPTPSPDVSKSVRTFSETEWNKRQSSWDKERAQMQQDYERRLSQLQAEHQVLNDELNKIRETSFLEAVQAQGGGNKPAKEGTPKQSHGKKIEGRH